MAGFGIIDFCQIRYKSPLVCGVRITEDLTHKTNSKVTKINITRSQAELDNSRFHTVIFGQACTCVPVSIKGPAYVCLHVQSTKKLKSKDNYKKPEYSRIHYEV